MDHSVTFARHFARLVWLLMNEGENAAEQKAALRAAVAVSKDGPVRLTTREWQLEANGQLLADSSSDSTELVSQLSAHGVRAVSFGQTASATEVLGVARILTSTGGIGGNGDGAEPRLIAPGARRSHFELLTDGGDVSRTEAAGTPDIELDADAASMWTLFAATQLPKASVEHLLARLETEHGVGPITMILDDLVAVVENAALESKPLIVAEAFYGVVQREASATNDGIKRAFAMCIRRMARPALLRAVAALLPHRPDKASQYEAILTRAGDDGADALIEQLTQAQASDDRRVYFDVLLRLQAGVPMLIHMLGDARWFVARNAAELLGEMKAHEAESALGQLLRSPDERVRRAATTALTQLDTPTARDAIYDAFGDDSPSVRVDAASALSVRGDRRTAGTLTRALDDENNPDVQYAILSALGRVATGDAVERLIAAAAPEGRFFRRKPPEFRAAAVQALGEAQTPAALAAVQALSVDRDREVRDAVARVLARVSGR